MYLETMLDDYLLELKLRNCSQRTIKTVKNNNTLFFNWLKTEAGIVDIENVRKTHIKGYLRYKQEMGLKPTYINGILKNIRMFFNYLIREEYLEVNPVASVRFQKEEKVIIKSFSAE